MNDREYVADKDSARNSSDATSAVHKGALVSLVSTAGSIEAGRGQGGDYAEPSEQLSGGCPIALLEIFQKARAAAYGGHWR